MCVLSMTAGAGLTAALATSLTSAGMTATAAGITSGLVVGGGLGAIDGAVMGAATSAITGGDVKKGALMGAAAGGVGGGAVGAWGGASSAASAAAPTAEDVATGMGTNLTNTANTTGEAVLDQGAEAQMLLTAQNGGTASNPFSLGADNAAVKATRAATSSDTDYGRLAAAGLHLAGGGVQAYGALEESKENAANLKKEAANSETQAQQTLDSAAVEARDLARRQKQLVGQGKTAAAANGVMLESRAEASPAMWERDARAESAWDREKLFYNANMKASALFSQANEQRRQARQTRRLGNLKAVTSLIQGGIGAGTSYYARPATTIYA